MSSNAATVTLKPPFRWAQKEDCYRLAELAQMSSGGVIEYVWSLLDEAESSLLEIGERRFAREDTTLSYRQCVVAAVDDDVAGMLVSFAEANAVTDYTALSPAAADVLAPYRELEAPDSYHICEMALLPQYQSQGLGTRLFEIAKGLARARGCAELSVRVFEQNIGAVRFYERLGCKEIDRRPVVPHELIRYTGDVLLMTVPVAVGTLGR